MRTYNLEEHIGTAFIGNWTVLLEKKFFFGIDALSMHKRGEIMLSGKTDVGYTSFRNQKGKSMLSFGPPYEETSHAYIRKLTLSDRAMLLKN